MEYGKDFTVEIPHFYCLEYTEGDYLMTVEMDFRDPVPCLYFISIQKWNPPHDNDVISKDKKEQIFENIYKYLTEIRNFTVDVEK